MYYPFPADPYEWVQQQMEVGASPREVLLSIVGEDCPLVSDLANFHCHPLQFTYIPPVEVFANGIKNLNW